MPQASRSQEYWRPANPKVARLFEPFPAAEACRQCETEYPPGARFCPACGSARERDSQAPDPEAQTPSGLRSWRDRLRWVSTACLALGIACGVIAGLTGFLYRTDTLVDWQAVQIWRVEWLLGAIAFLLAGILLKPLER